MGMSAQEPLSQVSSLMSRSTAKLSLGHMCRPMRHMITQWPHINRYSWTTLPMLEEVIGRVHELAMSNSADVDNGNDAIPDYDD